MKLNLGSHKTPIDGWVNVDLIPFTGREMILDLNKLPWPFEDNQFDEIRAYDIIEHLKERQETVEELARITKTGGLVSIRVPAYTSPTAVAELQHRQLYAIDSFEPKYSQQNFEVVARWVELVGLRGKKFKFVPPFRLLFRIMIRLGLVNNMFFLLRKRGFKVIP